MLKELKGFISGGYFCTSLLMILALCDGNIKDRKKIDELEKTISELSSHGEEVDE